MDLEVSNSTLPSHLFFKCCVYPIPFITLVYQIYSGIWGISELVNYNVVCMKTAYLLVQTIDSNKLLQLQK